VSSVTLSSTAALFLITLLAFGVKAATGFGPALVVVSLGSLFIGPVHAVILAAFLDLASGIGLFWIDRHRIRNTPWLAPAATMAAGAVVGAAMLDHVPTDHLARIVGFGVVAFGLWMAVGAPGPAHRADAGAPRSRAAMNHRWTEHAVAAIGGLTGGLIGVGGPPLIVYYGARLGKTSFRAMIVPILLAAALFRAATYAATGQVAPQVLRLVLVALPALPVGLWVGDRVFRRIPEDAFRRVVAVIVTVVGLRLLF
jgi:uncharacterized membrane protein YfcA